VATRNSMFSTSEIEHENNISGTKFSMFPGKFSFLKLFISIQLILFVRNKKKPFHCKMAMLKAGFHQQRSRSRNRSRSGKRAYDLVKIENRSRKWSHELDGIGVGRIRTFPFLPIPFATPSLMI